MPIKIDCEFNDRGAWCKNENVKKSIFGFGARCCLIYPYDNYFCSYKKRHSKPRPGPPPPIPKRFNIFYV